MMYYIFKIYFYETWELGRAAPGHGKTRGLQGPMSPPDRLYPIWHRAEPRLAPVSCSEATRAPSRFWLVARSLDELAAQGDIARGRDHSVRGGPARIRVTKRARAGREGTPARPSDGRRPSPREEAVTAVQVPGGKTPSAISSRRNLTASG